MQAIWKNYHSYNTIRKKQSPSLFPPMIKFRSSQCSLPICLYQNQKATACSSSLESDSSNKSMKLDEYDSDSEGEEEVSEEQRHEDTFSTGIARSGRINKSYCPYGFTYVRP